MNKNMTTQEMLASLEAQIRKYIPRLMELREGCRFVIRDEIYGEVVFVDFNYSVYFLLHNTLQTCDLKTLKDESVVKIIGHDIMLNDVLCWLQSLGLSMEIQSYNGENTIGLYYISIDEKGDAHEEYVTWNLLSPYLKDQSEEFINFLYNLIKE